jgi:subtilisin family serine protease
LFSDVAKGIDWATTHDADVISMSLGGPGCSATVQSKIDEANAEGVVVVAAAGNSNSNQIGTPGGMTGVITVGATTSSDQKAAYSNYGPYVDIGAPGDVIWSTVPGGFATKSGTSMATPFVAAAVALIKQKCPALSPDTVQQRIETFHGVSVSGLGAPLLDVDNALANAC